MNIVDVTLGWLTPETDPDSQSFWDSLGRGELELPRCNACSLFFFPPMPTCPHCGSADVGHAPSEGKGHIYSWSTVHIALHPAFAADVPYTVVVVDVEERARMMGRLLGSEPPSLGLAVQLVPYRTGEVVLPGFVVAQ